MPVLSKLGGDRWRSAARKVFGSPPCPKPWRGGLTPAQRESLIRAGSYDATKLGNTAAGGGTFGIR